MSDGYPSMTALLGLLALAGYQNRDKIAEMLRGEHGNAVPSAPTTSQGGSGGILGDIGKVLGGAGAGGFLGGGIGELALLWQKGMPA